MTQLIEGDLRQVLPTLDANSVDSIVCDPPYGLSFMSKAWDAATGVAFDPATWAEALRVLKPGGHLLAFGGTRTYHRLACAIEDAGFEIRDCLMWLYGTGFPKSLDISKALDKAAGARRPVIGDGVQRAIGGVDGTSTNHGRGGQYGAVSITAPATEAAREWAGWGTALKPAWEPIIMARKPLSEGTVAANVLRWGTGGIHVDGTRIAHGGDVDLSREQHQHADTSGMKGIGDGGMSATHVQPLYAVAGRWPANLCLDEEAAEELDRQSGEARSSGLYAKGARRQGAKDGPASIAIDGLTSSAYADSGGASRFFYCAKASRSERNAGLGALPKQYLATMGDGIGGREHNPDQPTAWTQNNHPTVKPLALMRWLCRLVTRPGGLVLDPFVGSGSTGVAAIQEGFDFIGVDQSAEYLEIAAARIAAASPSSEAA